MGHAVAIENSQNTIGVSLKASVNSLVVLECHTYPIREDESQLGEIFLVVQNMRNQLEHWSDTRTPTNHANVASFELVWRTGSIWFDIEQS